MLWGSTYQAWYTFCRNEKNVAVVHIAIVQKDLMPTHLHLNLIGKECQICLGVDRYYCSFHFHCRCHGRQKIISSVRFHPPPPPPQHLPFVINGNDVHNGIHRHVKDQRMHQHYRAVKSSAPHQRQKACTIPIALKDRIRLLI